VISAATALTVLVQGSHLLPGELAIARWLAEDPLPGTVAISEALDVGVGLRMAPLVFFALLPIVWRAWGRWEALTFLVAGGLTFAVRLAEFPYRPRPTDDLAWTLGVQGSTSYPSGHVVYAVLVFGLLAYLASRHTPRFWLYAVLVSLPAIMVIAIGPARIIVKDHWPADVAGGYLISLPLLMGVIWAHAHLLSWLGRRAPRVYSVLAGEPPG
jgi:membrane-associated phospholipid phosphatase